MATRVMKGLDGEAEVSKGLIDDGTDPEGITMDRDLKKKHIDENILDDSDITKSDLKKLE
jgi:hypothetical protein